MLVLLRRRSTHNARFAQVTTDLLFTKIKHEYAKKRNVIILIMNLNCLIEKHRSRP